MFSDIEEILTEGEQIQERTNPSVLDSKFIGSYILSSVLFVAVIVLTLSPGLLNLGINGIYFLALLVIPVGIALKAELQRRFVQYYITNKQVIMREGVLNQSTESTMYGNITDVTLNEVINERIFDVGDIRVNTAGHDGTTLVLNGVKDPERYKREIESNINSMNGGNNSNQGFNDQSFDNQGMGQGGGFDSDFDTDFDTNL
ncbi:MAG: PH domain-containing protein [Candidatus Nanohalobium sp.]